MAPKIIKQLKPNPAFLNKISPTFCPHLLKLKKACAPKPTSAPVPKKAAKPTTAPKESKPKTAGKPATVPKGMGLPKGSIVETFTLDQRVEYLDQAFDDLPDSKDEQ